MRGDIPHNEATAAQLQGVLRCEPPNPNLHYFIGKFSYRSASGACWRPSPPPLQVASHFFSSVQGWGLARGGEKEGRPGGKGGRRRV